MNAVKVYLLEAKISTDTPLNATSFMIILPYNPFNSKNVPKLCLSLNIRFAKLVSMDTCVLPYLHKLGNSAAGSLFRTWWEGLRAGTTTSSRNLHIYCILRPLNV